MDSQLISSEAISREELETIFNEMAASHSEQQEVNPMDVLRNYMETLPVEDLTTAAAEAEALNAPIESEETPEPKEEPKEITIKLPTNSPTLLMSETTSRFSSAEWYEKIQQQDITLAGLGGIGSYVAFLIGRMKPRNLVLYDPDIVDETNMSGQLYGRSSIGHGKVSSTVNNLYEFASYYGTTAFYQAFNAESMISDIAICGFDNMTARKVFYNEWKNHIRTRDKSKCLFIDGRLAAEELQVLCFTGEDAYLMKKYEREWLFSDAEAEQTVCSYKQTSFCANMIGSIMVNLLVNFVANQCDPLFPRALPFLTSYEAPTLIFKTEM